MYRKGPVMREAEELVRSKFNSCLSEYLRSETHRGQSDCSIARFFGVSRHTIRNWKRLFGMETVRRVVLKKQYEKGTAEK